MEQNIFYLNVSGGRFCLSDNPDEYGAKPEFRHGETVGFDLCLLNGDGSPHRLSGTGFLLAVDDNVDHSDELAVLSEDITADGNILHVEARCFSAKFAALVAGGEALVRYFELSEVADGERRVLFCDDTGVRFLPRVRMDEGIPAEVETLDFVTRRELDNAGFITREELPEIASPDFSAAISGAVSAHNSDASAHAGLLADKAPAVHTHEVSAVTGLETALNGKAASDHTHTAAQVGAEASGTVNAHNSDTGAHPNGFQSLDIGMTKIRNNPTFMYVPFNEKSIIFRNDGSAFYIMKSSSGSDTWDNMTKYPLRVNLTDGICYINGSAALNLAAPKFSSCVDYGAVSQLTVSEAGWLYAEVTTHDEYKKVLIYNQIVLSVGGTGDQRGSVFLPVKAGDAVKCTTSDGTLTAVDNMRIYRPMY